MSAGSAIRSSEPNNAGRDAPELVHVPVGAHPAAVTREPTAQTLENAGERPRVLSVLPVGEQDRVALDGRRHVEQPVGGAQPRPDCRAAFTVEAPDRDLGRGAGPVVGAHHRSFGGKQHEGVGLARDHREVRAVVDRVDRHLRRLAGADDFRARLAHRSRRVDDQNLGGFALRVGFYRAGARHGHNGMNVGGAVSEVLVLEDLGGPVGHHELLVCGPAASACVASEVPDEPGRSSRSMRASATVMLSCPPCSFAQSTRCPASSVGSRLSYLVIRSARSDAPEQ